MREFHGSLEEATFLLRCLVALGQEGIGPVMPDKLADGKPCWDDSADNDIIGAAVRKAWHQFSEYELDEIGALDVVPDGAVWDVEAHRWELEPRSITSE